MSFDWFQRIVCSWMGKLLRHRVILATNQEFISCQSDFIQSLTNVLVFVNPKQQDSHWKCFDLRNNSKTHKFYRSQTQIFASRKLSRPLIGIIVEASSCLHWKCFWALDELSLRGLKCFPINIRAERRENFSLSVLFGLKWNWIRCRR